jgi:hypothetical protein
MLSFRTAAPLALVAGVIGVAAYGASATPAESGLDPAVRHLDAPIAHASGGDAGPPTYPSIVDVRLVRTQAALDRAAAWVDQGQPGQAILDLNGVRSNMKRAWAAARYVIETAPPPVAGASGDAAGGLAFASPEETGFAVLSLQHTVATTAIGLVDAADATLLPNLRTTINAAINARNQAIKYIHSIAPPAPPPDDATSSGDPVVAGWGTLMPNLVPLLEDELQQTKGTLATMPTLSTGLKAFVRGVRLEVVDTRDLVNQFWPPLPTDD